MGEVYSNFVSQIQTGKMKNVNELLDYLKSRFAVKEFPMEGISKSFKESEVLNARHSYDAFLVDDQLIFRAYQIVKTEESAIYFSEDLTHYSPLEFPVESPNEENLLLFILEENTNHFYINNSCLHSELIIERGISEESVESGDTFFKEFEYSKQFVEECNKRINEKI